MEVHGFAMWFPRPETQDAPLEPRSATQDCGTDGMAAETQFPAVPNSRQRRSAARRSRFVTGKPAANYARSCCLFFGDVVRNECRLCGWRGSAESESFEH